VYTYTYCTEEGPIEASESKKEPGSHLVTEADGVIITNPFLPLIGIWDELIINPMLSCFLDKRANLPEDPVVSSIKFHDKKHQETQLLLVSENPRSLYQGIRRR
jgi:hypothetical protein